MGATPNARRLPAGSLRSQLHGDTATPRMPAACRRDRYAPSYTGTATPQMPAACRRDHYAPSYGNAAPPQMPAACRRDDYAGSCPRASVPEAFEREPPPGKPGASAAAGESGGGTLAPQGPGRFAVGASPRLDDVARLRAKTSRRQDRHGADGSGPGRPSLVLWGYSNSRTPFPEGDRDERRLEATSLARTRSGRV